MVVWDGLIGCDAIRGAPPACLLVLLTHSPHPICLFHTTHTLTLTGTEGWYAWSYFIPTDYPEDSDPATNWQIVNQFHDQPNLDAGGWVGWLDLRMGLGGKTRYSGLFVFLFPCHRGEANASHVPPTRDANRGVSVLVPIFYVYVCISGQSWDVFPPHNSSIALYLLNRPESQGE